MHAHGQSTLPGTSPIVLPSAIPDHELLGLIGRGAYGEVWLARNAIGTFRAVKVVHRQSFQRVEHFEREFKGLLKFEPISRSHDGLVDVLQIGRRDDAGYFFYVMELADAAEPHSEDGRWKIGDSTESAHASRHPPSSIPDPQNYAPQTLRSELQARGQLPPAECVILGIKLATALEHLHANGLVHRDIKPSNIIFVKGEPKLADIGLVTAIDDAHSLVGTVGYIPPEGPGTPQADLYSLGKVLYEIAFGKDRQDFPQLPPDLQSHPDYTALLELNEIILRACESNPRARYQSAQKLQADLTHLQLGRSVRQVRTRERFWAVTRKLAAAGAVVALLVAALTFSKGSRHDYTPDTDAARLYEKGRWHYNKLTTEDHKKAIDYLNQALEADPKFVKPYRELVAIYVWNEGEFLGNEENRRKIKELADKILAMDPRLAEGHTALSWWHFQGRDWRGAEDEIVRAIELNPNYAHARDIYSFYLSMLCRTADAQRQSQRSQELDPTARTTAMVAAWPFMAARQFDKAIAQLQRAVELEDSFPEAHAFLARCYEAQSKYPAAIEEYKKVDLLWGEDADKTARLYAELRKAYDTEGDNGYWQKKLQNQLSLPEGEQSAYDIAACYAKLGQNEKALDELERYFNVIHHHELKFEPLFDCLHYDLRFKALVKKAGLE